MRTTILTLAIITSSAAFAFSEGPETVATLDGWDLMATASAREIGTDADWRVEKTFPDAIRAGTNDFTISGYVVPVMAEAYTSIFLLVQDPADCPYCGGNGYGPVLEVELKQPTADMPEFSEVTLVGTLDLVEDDDTTQMFRLIDARVVK